MQLPPFNVPPPTSEFDKAAMESKEQELKRDFNVPLPIGYLIISIAIVLFCIVIVVMFGLHLL